MPNIIDYIEWRGDLGFENSPINEIDDIIFARFSYLPFKCIELKDIEYCTKNERPRYRKLFMGR